MSGVSGRGVICNRPCNGIEAIEQFGAEHLETGALIVYTSQDSVLQIAAHVDVLAPEELYAICAKVREALPPEHAVGRVIARPFTGAPGASTRTDGRRDFSIPPPGRSYLEELQEAASRSTRSARSASCSPASASTSSIRARRTHARWPRRPSCCAHYARGSCSRT